ncbi:MAG: hypothetical protein GY796_35685 [Chloroflexi bacterium]|nr:hypothetical protein [Chloroflexota bacterium]
MAANRIDRLYFVTASGDKFNDYQFLLGKYADLIWIQYTVEDPVTHDLSILIRRQVEAVKPLLPNLPFLVEQTNLNIRSWKGLPGNVTGLFVKGVGVDGICKMLNSFDDRQATVVTDLAFHAPDGRVSVFRGHVQGHITGEPRGTQIYGWDAIFVPNGYERTFAEMPLEQRNSISTRKVAVAKLLTAVLPGEQTETLLQNRIKLRQLMTRYFSKPELEALLFDLGIDKEELPENIKSELAQEIILYCERHGRTATLLRICREQRPNADWPEAL